MTPIALSYMLLGLVALLWPLVTLFVKRNVMWTQWLMMLAMFVMGLAVIMYGCFFNSFLCKEYRIVVLFMMMSLVVPPLTQAAISMLTHHNGVTRMSRSLLIPSVAMVGAMVLSVILGGTDMYREWIARGMEGHAIEIIAGEWRYNLIVAVNVYMYIIVLVGELVFVMVYSIRSMVRFIRVMKEYYSRERLQGTLIRDTLVAAIVVSLCATFSVIYMPFNSPRELWMVALLCVIQGLAVFIIGANVYNLNFGAEHVTGKMKDTARRKRFEMNKTGREICRYVEETGFLQPDITVFDIAQRFNVSQDDVVDTVHRLHGSSFAEYVDTLRVQHVVSTVLSQNPSDAYDSDYVLHLARQCGYLSAEALERAFKDVMQVSINQWINGGGLK